jgi:maltooligosyltrehalose trehalohydrolase
VNMQGVRDARFGPQRNADGSVSFRLWAPDAQRVELLIGENAHDMRRDDDGWFEVAASAGDGDRYAFRIDSAAPLPDPASQSQPEGVHGWSALAASGYRWQQPQWRGRSWEEAVILEIHVGTFTPAGTFRGVIEKLDDVAATGITAIELMPIAEFAGERNWGYDGVLWYAPKSHYGSSDDLKALIDAAHARGLMVLLDVVYNHFGPEGNYLRQYAKAFFTHDRVTPWGDALDYRVSQVRAFAIQNALYWLDEFHFDGLRLDAVHAIVEPGEPPMLNALSDAVGALAREQQRLIHLVLENDDNRASLLDPETRVPKGSYRAQWNDDYHHAWHVLLTDEDAAYYVNYADDPCKHLCRSLASGFAYQGEPFTSRNGEPRGETSAHLSPLAFITFLQNHDQIGNRAFGERLSTLTSERALIAAIEITLLAPMPPMLFMGEEWGTQRPFPFFCDFSGELAEAVSRGRKQEFASLFEKLPPGVAIPDPIDPATFQMAALDWSEREQPTHAARLTLMKQLLTLRHRELVPRLRGVKGGAGTATVNNAVIDASWALSDGARWHLIANLGANYAALPSLPQSARQLYGEKSEALAPDAVRCYVSS